MITYDFKKSTQTEPQSISVTDVWYDIPVPEQHDFHSELRKKEKIWVRGRLVNKPLHKPGGYQKKKRKK